MIDYINYSDDIINICNNDYMALISLPNVVGVAYGYKSINGKLTSNECIIILVEKKLPLDKLNNKSVIPNLYKGILTDVFECGIITPYYNDSYLRCGDSIGPASIGSGGTAGAIVKGIYNRRTSYYILSNNHVLAAINKAPLGTPILHPSPYDGGIYPNDQIATLSRYIPIRFINRYRTPENKVDCAIARIKDLSIISDSFLPSKTSYAYIGQEVEKIGRSTGLTEGKIISTCATIKVEYDKKGKFALFKNQLVTHSMSEKGDSGSLLVDKYGRALGLLFSGTEKVTLFNKISDVLTALDVKLVTSNNFAL